MKKEAKKAYKYVAVMLVFVIAILIMVCLSESRLENQQKEFQDKITIEQKQVEVLEKKVDELEEEKKELKEQLEKKMAIESDLGTQTQAMNDLVEIYKLIEDNKIAAAKEKFRKIETMGFDDSALALYGAIEKILLK